MAKYSVIIKNGIVIDGKNNPPVKADVGVSEDEISSVGDLFAENADNVFDVSGCFVTPGFIDITNHSDTNWTIFSSPGQESLTSQGVTTIIGGNCGSSLAPFLGESSARELEHWADISNINVNWQKMGEFLGELDRHKLGINFGTFVGFNTIRRALLLENSQRLAKAGFLLMSALDEGAFGLSANLGLAGSDFFSDDEMVDIFKILNSYDSFAKHHLEDEGAGILPAVSRMISLARKSDSRMHVSHFKAAGRSSWSAFPEAMKMMESARREKVKITCDFFPYTKTGSSLISLMPAWFRKYSHNEAKEILNSKNDKRRLDLKNYLRNITLHYDKIIIASAIAGVEKMGKTIKNLSDDSEIPPEEIVFNLLEANDLRVSIFNEVVSEDNIDILAGDDYSAISSDGVGYDNGKYGEKDLPHPRSFGSFPRAFDLFVKKKELISWEGAVYKMTGLPATILGIKNRGILEQGKKADIIVFNPSEISDTASYEKPLSYSAGVKYVFINGKAVILNGKFTGNMPGEVLRKNKTQ